MAEAVAAFTLASVRWLRCLGGLGFFGDLGRRRRRVPVPAGRAARSRVPVRRRSRPVLAVRRRPWLVAVTPVLAVRPSVLPVSRDDAAPGAARARLRRLAQGFISRPHAAMVD